MPLSHWSISRSRHPVLLLLRASLPSSVPDISSNEEDYYLWRNGLRDPPSTFSSSKLWSSLYQFPPQVSWLKAVWFKKNIPKHAFIMWLVMRGRMSTRDRLLTWGLDVSPLCLLCGTQNESLLHIFFECDYASAAWRSVTRSTGLQLPARINDIVPFLLSIRLPKRFKTIMLLILQATIYHLWLERNSRLHNRVSRPYNQIVKGIFLHLRAKLYSLDKEVKSNMIYTGVSASTSTATKPSYLSLVSACSTLKWRVS